MKRKTLLLFILMLLHSISVLAQEPSPEIADIEGSAFQPLIDLIHPFFLKLSVIVGGIFGLYVILIVMRVYYERKNMILLEQIRYDFDHLNQYYGIPSSREKVGFFHRYLLDALLPSHIHKHKSARPPKKRK